MIALPRHVPSLNNVAPYFLVWFSNMWTTLMFSAHIRSLCSYLMSFLTLLHSPQFVSCFVCGTWVCNAQNSVSPQEIKFWNCASCRMSLYVAINFVKKRANRSLVGSYIQSLIHMDPGLLFQISCESQKCFIFPFPPLYVSFPKSFFVRQSVCRQQQGSLSADRRSLLPAESRPINHVNMLISGIYFIQQK